MSNQNKTPNPILPTVVSLFVKYVQANISLQDMVSRFDKIYYENDEKTSQYFSDIMEKISLTSNRSNDLYNPSNHGLLISESDLRKHIIKFLHKSIDDLSN